MFEWRMASAGYGAIYQYYVHNINPGIWSLISPVSLVYIQKVPNKSLSDVQFLTLEAPTDIILVSQY